ncbi:hypothetical protein DPMN_072771 [Dreissena polymorpha]|uniref:Uncharacterized protein n=1 Tax=Dreissena polymorpha TaxID=45954 RepID=A0A9D4HC75_DREPO|nr:hypothetical protein DPMN_072771 [Dreissena polymorpha]
MPNPRWTLVKGLGKAPREFWKSFKQKSPSTNAENVSIYEFYEYLSTLSSYTDVNANSNEYDEFLHEFDRIENQTSSYPELDKPFSLEEIKKGIKRLNYNKAASYDIFQKAGRPE